MRRSGFYWIRIKDGDGEPFVGEWTAARYKSLEPRAKGKWEIPGSTTEFGSDDVEVLSERLSPPGMS